MSREEKQTAGLRASRGWSLLLLSLIYLVPFGSLRAQNITTVAGNGIYGFTGDGGQATNASLRTPTGVAVDNAGNFYIADTENNRIRKVDINGNITTVAGSGTAVFSGDGGLATSASLNLPLGVAVDSDGNLYIADSGNNRIRKVTGGVITTVAGTGSVGFSGDNNIATSAKLNRPEGIAVDADGDIFISDSGNNRIRKVAGGIITTVAGDGNPGSSGDGGLATDASLFEPNGVFVDGLGNLFIADKDNNRVRKVNSSGIINTVAGMGDPGSSGDGGPAIDAELAGPRGVAIDGAGNLYIVDQGNERVRRVDTGGIITTVAGGGNPMNGIGDDERATDASLIGPYGIAIDQSRSRFLIADLFNNRIRAVEIPNTAPVATTIAGQNGTQGTPFSFTVPAFTDPENQSLTYAITGVPVGLTANNDTRIISGTPSSVGVFSVTVVGTDTGNLSATTTFAITIICPALSVGLTGNNIGCGLTSSTLTATASLPGTYTYVFSNGATQVGTTNRATAAQTGIYSVTAINAEGCSATNSVEIGANQELTNAGVIVSGRLSPSNSSVVLQASGGGSYELLRSIEIINGYRIRASEPSTTGSFIVTREGQYWVTIIGSNGCQSEVVVTVARDN